MFIVTGGGEEEREKGQSTWLNHHSCPVTISIAFCEAITRMDDDALCVCFMIPCEQKKLELDFLFFLWNSLQNTSIIG